MKKDEHPSSIINRRSFLSEAALVAGAMAIPSIVPARVMVQILGNGLIEEVAQSGPTGGKLRYPAIRDPLNPKQTLARGP